MEEQEIPKVIHNNKKLEKLIEKKMIKREESNLLFLKKDTWYSNETFFETIDDLDENFMEDKERQKQFWEIISKLIVIYKKDNYDTFDFSYIIFPSMTYQEVEIPSKIFSHLGKKVIFDNTTFVSDSDFSDMIFTDGVSFNKTKFLDEVSFNGVNFNKETNFNEIYFENKVDFTNSTFENVIFSNIQFQSYVIFQSVHFRDVVKFIASDFKTNVSFEDTKFFKNTNFDKLNFEDKVSFHNAIANKEISLLNVRAKTLNLNAMSFSKLLLRNIEVDNLYSLYLHGREKFEQVSIEKFHFQDKETARIIKASFEKSNNITESNRYFVFEQELYLNEVKNNKGIIIPLLINKYVSNFGVDWVRALVLLIVLSYLFMCGYIGLDTYLNIKNKDIEHFTKAKDIQYIWGMISAWMLFYISTFCKSTKYILYSLGSFVLLMSWSIYDNVLSMQNYIVQLINPINVFKSMNLYDGIEIYGVLVRVIVITIIYQFIVAFRQNTRRK